MAARRPPTRCTRSGFRASWLCITLAALTQCQPAGVELLQVDAVSPAEAQFGDSVQVIGDGFGLGSPATVTFRGHVHRAGRPEEPVEFSFRAQTESQRELVLQLPRDAESAFCGDAEHASHATFRGDVEVAIAARAPGAPPATGRVRGVVLELYPAVKTRGSEDRSSTLGRDVLGFLGIEVAAGAGGGLEVIQVVAGSRAAAADLRAGDRLLRAGGVTVLQPSDLAPDGSRALELGVSRANVETALRVDVDGFAPRPPRELAWAAIPILAAALWFIGSLSPLSRLLGWAGQNWLEQERARLRALRRGPERGARGAEWPSALELAGGAAGVLVWLGVGAALSAPLLRRVPLDVTLGLLFSMFVSAALLVALAFAGGGESRRRWSIQGALAAAWHQCSALLPAGVALLATCLDVGIDLDEVVHSQGAWPWQWNAFRGPGLFIACGTLLLGALPRPGKPAWRLAHARPPRLSWRSDGDGWFDRLYLCSTCAVASLVFFGADALPGAALPGATLPGASVLGVVLSVGVLLLKYTLVVLVVSFLRGLCLGISAAQWSAFSWRFALPAALAAVALAQAWRSLGRSSPFWSWVELGFGPASVAVTALALVLVALRVHAASREPGPPSLSPWL